MSPEGAIYAIDTSALMTLMEDEDGAERVSEVLRGGRVILPFVVLFEIYYKTLQERGQDEADRRHAILKGLDAEIQWSLDEPTLLTAARFKAFHHVSLADSIIAAITRDYGATLLHKDPEYEALVGEIELEGLPYKGKTTPGGAG